MELFKKTKIICTIGPAVNNEDSIKNLIDSGMNIARLNFSHGTLEQHNKTIDMIRKVSASLKANVSILQDLPGPKIRIGKLDKDFYILNKNEKVILSRENLIGDNIKFSCSHPGVVDSLKVNDILFINDGRIKLEVIDKNIQGLVLNVINSGEIRSFKGMNIPSKDIIIEPVTMADVGFINFGIKKDIDFIAASFIRRKEDILKIRKIVSGSKKNIHILAKIERVEALENIESILDVSDGIMIARGDLGIEIPLEKIGINQKFLVDKARRHSKPSIVATQMLRSMVDEPIPTRAEVSDVTNAIIDGADALMLSEETAIGNYPVDSCMILNNISLTVENEIKGQNVFRIIENDRHTPELALCDALKELSSKLDIKAIIVITRTGRTAQLVSSKKFNIPIYAFTEVSKVIKFLNLSWGVIPCLFKRMNNKKLISEQILEIIKKNKLVESNSFLIITYDTLNKAGISTNIIEIQSTL